MLTGIKRIGDLGEWCGPENMVHSFTNISGETTLLKFLNSWASIFNNFSAEDSTCLPVYFALVLTITCLVNHIIQYTPQLLSIDLGVFLVCFVCELSFLLLYWKTWCSGNKFSNFP